MNSSTKNIDQDRLLLIAGFERDGAGNIRAVIEIPGELSGTQIFKGKWVEESSWHGSPDMLVPRLQQKAIRLAAVRFKWSVSRMWETVRMLSRRFRPAGRPEIIAEHEMTDGGLRRYWICADCRLDSVVYEVVCDRVRDGLVEFDSVLDGGISTYEGAVNSVAVAISGCRPNGGGDLKFYDKQAREFYIILSERRRESQRKLQEEADLVERDRQASALANRDAWNRLRAEELPKFRRKTIQVVLTNGAESIWKAQVAYVCGHLAVSKDDEDGRFRIHHLLTGFGVTQLPASVQKLEDAKRFAMWIARMADWNFDKAELAPRGLGSKLRELSVAWVDHRWIDVEKLVTAD